MKKEVFRMSENENNQYRLLSPWAYVGYGILFTLPVIGWILAIVFALMTTT